MQRFVKTISLIQLFTAISLLSCKAPAEENESPVEVSTFRYLKGSSAEFSEVFRASSNQFQELSGPIINIERGAAWIRIDLIASGTTRELFLDAGPVPLHILSIYSIHPGEPVESARQYRLHFPDRMVIPVALSSDGKASVYLQVLSRIPIHLNIKGLTREALYHLRIEEKVTAAIFMTIVVILVIYFAFLLGIVRDPLFAYFILFSIAHSGYYLYFSGLLLDFVPGIAANRIVFTCGVLIIGTVNLIVSRFFHVKEMAPLIDKVLLFFTTLLGVEYLLFFFFPAWLIQAYFATNILNGLVILIVLGRVVLKRGNPERLLASILISGQVAGFISAFYHSGVFGMLIPALSVSELLFQFVFYFGMLVTLMIFTIFFLVGFAVRKIPGVVFEIQSESVVAGLEQIRSIVSTRSELEGLDEELISAIAEKLRVEMEEERVYLEGDLTLAKLARKMEVQPWNLSFYINRYMKKTFRDLLMEYRVRAAAARIRSEEDWTLLRVALESGFDSKATFNRAFQKVMGMTPTEYKRHLKASSL